MFYIFDSFHNIFGNPKGYKTYRGAKRIVAMRRRELYAIADTNTEDLYRLVWEIRHESVI